jgi:hypothetical protein
MQAFYRIFKKIIGSSNGYLCKGKHVCNTFFVIRAVKCVVLIGGEGLGI